MDVASKDEKLPEGLAEAEGEGDAAEKPKPDRRKRLIIIGAAAVLALGGGGGAYMMLAGGKAEKAEAATDDAPAEGEEETFVDLPPLTVNLRTADGAQRFLKVHLMLVPGKVAGDVITKKLPLILDAYQPFLRELRPEDIAGSAATFRLKEEMLVRANALLGTGAVRDVLIQDLVQQ